MNVTLRQLRLFLQLSKELNFSRTGDLVGLSQPAVSHAIVELESQLGLKVLDRTTREVVLTEAGRAFATELDRILDDLDHALRDVAVIASARGGKVRVGSSPTLSAGLMPDCIAACAQLAPELRLIVLDRIQDDVLASVRAGDVDFGVVVEPSTTDDLTCEVLEQDPFVLAVARSDPLARRRSITWATLAGRSLVLLDQASGSRRLIDEALARHGVTCEIKQEVGHPTTAFRMVERGIGLSVLPGFAVRSAMIEGIAIVPLLPRIERTIMLVRRRNRALSPAALRVWELLKSLSDKTRSPLRVH